MTMQNVPTQFLKSMYLKSVVEALSCFHDFVSHSHIFLTSSHILMPCHVYLLIFLNSNALCPILLCKIFLYDP